MERVDYNKYNNDWYRQEIGAGKLKQLLWYLVNVCVLMNPLIPFAAVKRGLLKAFGAKIGAGVVIKPRVSVKYPWKLVVGDHCWIGEGVWIDNLAPVVLGKNVCLSQGAMLLTGNHDYTKVSFDLMVRKIDLEDGVWVGAKSLVCPGVTCKTHAVLAAMSVASKDLEAYGIYQGNPAIFIKQRVIAQ
jgi:putative colanic acid biosynthesis acetyltransferase WcaF